MAYSIAIYDWSLYTLPAAIPMSDIEGDTYPNGPAMPNYNPSAPSWVGETFTYNGGSSTLLDIADDDSNFQDGYVETGGAQTLNQAVTINGTTYPAGAVVENEFSMLDASGNEIFVLRIDGVNIGFTYPTGQEPDPGDDFIGTLGRDGDPADSGDGQGTSSPYQQIVCFTDGTLIDTADGPKPVQDLRAGDAVLTRDHGMQPVLWAGCSELAGAALHLAVKPIMFAAGCLGPQRPSADLAVSPQHKMLLDGPLLQDLFGLTEALVPAKGLLALSGVRRMRGKRAVTYHHILLPQHGILCTAGAQSESFYPGETAMRMLSDADRAAIEALVPGVTGDVAAAYGPQVRPAITVQEARILAEQMRNQVACAA